MVYWNPSLEDTEIADKQEGITGENLLRLLESLDNVVYRLGCFFRAEARQLVTHGHFRVNGEKVDIPSYLVSAGDIIAVKRDLSSNKSEVRRI